jgi:hypothetical protein
MRIVRLVASVAGHAAGVFSGNDLREGGGFGCILFMAAAAEVGDVGEFGDEGGRVIGMFGEGAMAGFAGDVGVFAGVVEFGLIVMAHGAGFVAGVGDGAGANEVECAGAIVAILTEGFGDDEGAQTEEGSHGEDENYSGTNEMSPVMQQAAQGHPLCESAN